MNKKGKLIYFVTGLVLTIIAFLVMHYIFNWPVKKSLIISGGAMIAMFIADSIAFYFIEKKKQKNINQGNLNSTNPNTP